MRAAARAPPHTHTHLPDACRPSLWPPAPGHQGCRTIARHTNTARSDSPRPRVPGRGHDREPHTAPAPPPPPAQHPPFALRAAPHPASLAVAASRAQVYRSLQGARATKVLTFRFARYLPKARVVPAFERALLKRVAAERADEAKQLCCDLVPDGGLLADDEISVTYRDDGATVEAALRRRRGGALETTPLFTRSDAELWSAFQGCYFDDKTAAPQTRVELTRRLPPSSTPAPPRPPTAPRAPTAPRPRPTRRARRNHRRRRGGGRCVGDRRRGRGGGRRGRAGGRGRRAAAARAQPGGRGVPPCAPVVLNTIRILLSTGGPPHGPPSSHTTL